MVFNAVVMRGLAKPQAGTVISAGRMQRTITVRMAKQEWNRKLRKNYVTYYHLFAHDHNSSAVIGDVVSLAPFHHSKTVRHAISDILAPFGTPISERPPILTPVQRMEVGMARQDQRHERQTERKAAVRRAEREMEGDKIGTERIIGDEHSEGGVQVVLEVGKGGHAKEKKIMQHGREVLPSGRHKYGKINDEATRGRHKAEEYVEKTKANEEELRKLEQTER